MKVLETYIVRESQSPYEARKVYLTEGGLYFMDLGGVLCEIHRDQFLELKSRML